MAQSFRTVVIDARKNQKLSLAENQDSESMRKLRSLREKILKEYEAEKSERETIDQREPIIPISLASDFIQKQKSSSGSYDAQQEVREKVKYLKLDRVLQNELEAGLEVKANEMNGLKYQNKRLRDIIMLRESCNTRKEKTFEQEISFLKNLIDDVCIESMEHDTMMQRLRALNEQIQDEFELLKTTIEEKAETERLALIRTYRVRMRDVKQQLSIQEEKNLAGAKAWITRYEMLDRDRAEAEKDCENLKMQNASISDSNNEIRVMHQHQDRQRESLTYKIVMLKRENKRLENHIQTLSEKLPVMNRHTLTYNPLKHDETFNRKDLQKKRTRRN
eukprot:Tbor_TRINITY_DN5249_c0_g2::TRINITY_DN5249_c0_g2_i2::g.16780::m.16780